MIEYRNLRVAILGAGSVGAQVAALLLEHGDELANRVGAGLELVGIAVRDLDAPRTADIPRELLTTDANSLILGADIVIELIGGLEPAREYVSLALNSGADVITGNKALLATHGPELFAIAEQVGAQLVLRGRRRRRHPDHPPAARQPGRRPGAPHPRHRQRHDQLHPRPHGPRRRQLRAGPRRRHGARLRRGRPDGRRRGLRRRAEGDDPGEPRLPHHGSARGRAPRGHQPHHPRAGRRRTRGRLRRQAARRLRAPRRMPRPASRE